MARQKHHKRWWPAGLWLPLLLTASPSWATVIDSNSNSKQQNGLVARIPGASDNVNNVNNVADFFRRLAAPLAEAAAEPNVMAADADEQTQQLLQAIVRREELLREARENPAPAKVARQPLQTPAPVLGRRQDDGQIQALSAQIQSISLVASSISQASRQVSQTSQQLAQQVTQLSQSTDRLSQSINSLQNSAQQAQQSAQQAQDAARQASDAARQASQSASQVISSAISSAQSSADAVVASNLASITSSASAIIASASASAAQLARLAASQVQSAQADATIARADAATQVQQAQGTAVSVTQAALAIVGAFVGSSLLTILAFYLVLRYKTNRKRRRTRLIATRGDIGYPKQQDDGNGDDNDRGDRGTYGYPIDLKDPPRKSVSADNVDGGGDGGFNEKRPEAAYLRNPSIGGAGFGLGGAFGSGSGSSLNMTGGLPANGPAPRKGSNPGNGRSSFSLFPKTPEADIGVANGSPQQTQAQPQTQPAVSPSIYATGTTAMTNTLSRANTTTNNPTRAPPSLQQWLREGTVSPFGTLKRDSQQPAGGAQADNSAPASGLDRKQQQLRAMMKRSMGVGGVNAGGGGSRVMQPGGSLPLRDN